jgi:hypothetical protein
LKKKKAPMFAPFGMLCADSLKSKGSFVIREKTGRNYKNPFRLKWVFAFKINSHLA